MSLALDALGLVAVAGFVGMEGALEVAVVLDWVAGGTAFAAGVFVAGGTTFAADGEGLAGLGVAAAGVLVAVAVVAFTGAVVLGVVLGAVVTAGALFGLAATAGDFAVPASVAAGLPPSAVVMDLVEVEATLGVIAVVVEVLGAGVNNEVGAGAEATLVAALAGGAALGV